MAEPTKGQQHMSLARLYAEKLGPRGPIRAFGPAWVAQTQRFGRQLSVAGVITAAIGMAHPDTSWLATLVVMGIITAVIGIWHVRNAEAISVYGASREST